MLPPGNVRTPGREAPVVDKQPEPAFADQEFVREAKQARSVTFIAELLQGDTDSGRYFALITQQIVPR